MNVLILLNDVPSFPQFFEGVAAAFKKNGHQVHFALNSDLIFYQHPQYRLFENVSVFSQYFSETHTDLSLLQAYDDYNFWTMFFADFDRYENYGINLDKKMPWYQRLASSLIGFFEKQIGDNGIDIVLYENISNSFSYFAYIVAARLGVTYVGLATSRVPDRFELHHSISGIRADLQKTYEAVHSRQLTTPDDVSLNVSNYLAGFAKIQPDYMKSNQLWLTNPLKKYANASKFRVVRSRFSFVIREDAQNYPYAISNPLFFSFRHFIRNSLRYLRSPFVKKYYSKTSPDDDFFLYPLHFHPEASTSLHARYYVDEYVTIKNIAFSLPFNSWLYVKDHSSATCYQRVNFYKKISRLPNVKLLAPYEDTKSIIAASRAVITLTSTVGFEAIVLKKPVYVLGDVFYDFHPLCRKVPCWAELPGALLQDHAQSVSDASVVDFLSAYWVCTYSGSLRYDVFRDSGMLASTIVQRIEETVSV